MSPRFPLAVMLVLSACSSGGNPGDVSSSEEKGLALPDVSRAPPGAAPSGSRIDAGVMRARSIAGTWTATSGDHFVRVSFGNAGTVTVEDYVLRGGKEALVGGASGTYGWRPDGVIAGTLKGAEGMLAPFASFRVSFASVDAGTVHGEGASIRISQKKSGRRP